MSEKKLADRLDWSAMLGFEQVVDSRQSLRSSGSQRLGAKVGEKPGNKLVNVGTKTGIKSTARIGVKTGLKSLG